MYQSPRVIDKNTSLHCIGLFQQQECHPVLAVVDLEPQCRQFCPANLPSCQFLWDTVVFDHLQNIKANKMMLDKGIKAIKCPPPRQKSVNVTPQ